MAERKRVGSAEARASLGDLVGEVQEHGRRIKITRYGKTAAYLVPPEDGESLEECAHELGKCRERRRGVGAPTSK